MGGRTSPSPCLLGSGRTVTEHGGGAGCGLWFPGTPGGAALLGLWGSAESLTGLGISTCVRARPRDVSRPRPLRSLRA